MHSILQQPLFVLLPKKNAKMKYYINCLQKSLEMVKF